MEPPDKHPVNGEEPLVGGLLSTVVRAGDTVRRSTGPWTPAVHALLRYLEDVGFGGAPRGLGIDEKGREVLSFLPGEVPDRASPEVATERVLEEIGRLLRRYHDAVIGFELPPGVRWHYEPLPGPKMVVCHNDVSPRNTVFHAGRPVAFLDWDLAALAPAAWDLAQAAWQFVPLSDDAGCRKHGWPSPPNRVRRLRMLCDAYGLPEEDRKGFGRMLVRRMESTASGIERLATKGVVAHERLVGEGVPKLVRAEKDWVERHADELDVALIRKSRNVR